MNKIIEIIRGAKNIAIYTHINPDGDALGSAYALKLALIGMGKNAGVFLENPCGTVEFQLINDMENLVEISENECDLKISVDCADLKRLGAKAKAFTGNTIAIDHHITHVTYAAETLNDGTCASCGEMIYSLLRAMEIPLTLDAAHNLYLAIVCDTGGFKYPNVTSETHRIAGELIDLGVDFAGIYKKIYDTYTVEYLALYRTALEKITLHCGGRIAVLTLFDEDFKNAGIAECNADGVVYMPRTVAGVEVGVSIRHRAGLKGYKVSLRSNNYVNVAEIAQKFGGGGHKGAAGYEADGAVETITAKVIKEIEKQILM